MTDFNKTDGIGDVSEYSSYPANMGYIALVLADLFDKEHSRIDDCQFVEKGE